MTVRELNREQLIQLKQKFIDDQCLEEDGVGASYEELANADRLISDEEGFQSTRDMILQKMIFYYSIER